MESSDIQPSEETKRLQYLSILARISAPRTTEELSTLHAVSSHPYALLSCVKTKKLTPNPTSSSSFSDNRNPNRSTPKPTKLKTAWSNENHTITRLLPATKLCGDVLDSADTAKAQPESYLASRNLTTGTLSASLATGNLDYAQPVLPTNISLFNKSSSTNLQSSNPIMSSLLSYPKCLAHIPRKHLIASDNAHSAATNSNTFRVTNMCL